MASRTLQVRCSSWEQVDIFTTRKLRKGKLLSIKVPFSAKTGMAVTIGLELPNEVVVAIEGVGDRRVRARRVLDVEEIALRGAV